MSDIRSAPRIWLALCLLTCLPWAPALALAQTTLFTEERPIELELRIELDALCRNTDQAGCENVPATLIYHAVDGQEESFAVEIRTRGKWRLKRSNCKYPPLFVVFGQDTQGTLFDSQDLLPLTTHCRDRGGRYEDYVLREYLAYHIYQLLTDKSVRTRLAHVTYAKPWGERPAGPYYAFLSEHFRSVAKRNNTEILKVATLDLSATDAMELATMELFQYMIGNTDFSVLGLHNILPIRDLEAPDNAGVAAVPFDFDFSGLVSAEYAGPPPDLPIRSTRQRMYRGFCNPAIEWDALFARFRAIEPRVFELLDTLPGLSKYARINTRRFLERFYETLDDPERRQRRIIEACR